MSSQPRIAIVGGGPAGLTLGLLLHRRGIPFTVFELRQKPTDEELLKPSGMLDLHQGSGLEAIKECGLYEDFISLTGECTEDFIISERNATTVYNIQGNGSRPEISRNNLSRLLLSKIPMERVKWGYKLLSVSSCNGETVLDFGPHAKHTFDLVLGADGAWSKVRKVLTDIKPHYSGMQLITLTIKEITRKYPHLAQLVGLGSFISLGNKHAVVSQRGPIDSARIYVWLTIPDDGFTAISDTAVSSVKDKILSDEKFLGTFGPIVKDLVATGCDEEIAQSPKATSSLDIKALYELCHGMFWEHKPGITLVGDAAHLMLPNGKGVNSAMFDSLLLSRAIIKAYDETIFTLCATTEKSDIDSLSSFHRVLDPLLNEFEVDMVERSQKDGKHTDIFIEKMFQTDNAAYEVASFFQSKVQKSA